MGTMPGTVIGSEYRFDMTFSNLPGAVEVDTEIEVAVDILE